MSSSAHLLFIVVVAYLFITLSCQTAPPLSSLSVSQLKTLIQEKNLPECVGCAKKKDFVTYLEQLEHIRQIPAQNSDGVIQDEKLRELKQKLDLNQQMENVLKGQESRQQQIVQEKAKEYERKLISGLIHVFAEWILTCSCIVGIFFVLSELTLFYKPAFISFMYFIMLGSVAVASTLGMMKYFGGIVEFIVEYPNGFKQQIVEWIAGHMWDGEVVVHYHTLASKFSGHVMPLLFMATGRYLLAYSYMPFLLVIGVLELGAGYIMLNAEKLSAYLQFAQIAQEVLPIFSVVMLIASSLHFLLYRERDYRPVATSLLFGCSVLIFSDYILKHGDEYRLVQYLEEKFFMQSVDLFHLVLSVTIVVIVMLTRVPGLAIYKDTMTTLHRKRGEQSAEHDGKDKPKTE